MSAEQLLRLGDWRARTGQARRTLNLGLDVVDGIGRLHLKGDGLAREGLDEDLHVEDLREEVSRQLSG